MTELYYQETEFHTVTEYKVNGLNYKLVGYFDDYNEMATYQLLAYDKEQQTYTIGTIKPIDNGQFETVGVFFELENHVTYFENMDNLSVIVETLANNHNEQLAIAKQSKDWKAFTEYMLDFGVFL